jgi:RNA polymerase sigma-70 factor (ECF subfamily)
VDQLAAASRGGDLAAFEQLVGLYRDGLRAFVARWRSDPWEAEDVAQEAFLQAYRDLPAFRGDSSFRSWLYRIASNLVLDAMRRRRPRSRTYSLDAPRWRQAGSVTRELAAPSHAHNRPKQHVETSELRREIDGAILDLSPKLRAVIILREVQGLPYTQIAAVLGCPLGTVKSRLFCARSQLTRGQSPAGDRRYLPAGHADRPAGSSQHGRQGDKQNAD